MSAEAELPGMFGFRIDQADGPARAGTLALPHGAVLTPAFMPVGTYGTVRGLHPAEVADAGAQIILGNTYHLHLRPGEAVIRTMGGLHRFVSWPRPMLTDSGGFQVFSLAGLRRIEEGGVEFTSHIDGSVRTLTPESSMEIQAALGADVAMAFDHVVPGQASWELAEEGMERTLRWLDRCRKRHDELTEGREDGKTEGQGIPLASDRGPPLHYMHAVHVPPATEEVIHCLQSQGSPAAAEQHCMLRPGRHFEPGGAAKRGPFFLPPSFLA